MEEEIDSKLFRMLERVDGSTNVVKWKTEKINYNDEIYTVYNLTKRYYNPLTGMTEVRATVPVARKQPTGSYYILRYNEDDGSYSYTNQVIEYNNNGKLYLDLIEPIYVYGNWPEKLYNDLKVIYEDINIDNYINYDNWADMLGEYYSPSQNVTDDNVVSFATTLIHPLGLIMSELFLGVTFESDDQLTDFSFTTQYLEETIQALCFAVGGESKYWQLKCEIESFVDMFNGLFTPIVEELQKIEGFDLYNEDEYSVQAYVYKSYLASIMLSDSANDYFKTLGYEIYNLNNLAAVIYNSTSNYVYDSQGNVLYDFDYKTDEDGNYLKILFTPKEASIPRTGKYVYNVSGEKVVVCDEYGYISESSKYVPIGGVNAKRVRFDEKEGMYEIKYNNKYYNYQTYNIFYKEKIESDPSADIPTWKTLFDSYFNSYYTFRYDHENTFTYEGEKYSILCNRSGNIVFKNEDKILSVNDSFLNDNGIYYVPKEGVEAIVTRGAGGYLKYQVLYQNKFIDATSGSINFDDYFEPAKARLYVYDNIDESNPYSMIGFTPARDIIISSDDEEVEDTVISFNIDYSIANDSTDYEVRNPIFINNQMNVLSLKYCLYEKSYTPKAGYTHSTYDELPSSSKAIVDGAIKYLHDIAKTPSDLNSTFLPFLELYKSGQVVFRDEEIEVTITMDEIFASPMISANKAKEYESELSDSIKYILENQNKTTKKVYKNHKELICSYYKHKIVSAIHEYMSYRISSGYKIIVNGQPFTVSQAMSSTKFMEIVFGNNLTYDSLVSELQHGAFYADLNEFNQNAMVVISSHLRKDISDLSSVISKLKVYKTLNAAIYNPKAYSTDFELSNHELELINNFYMIKTGDSLNATVDTIAKYLKLATKGTIGSYNSYMYDNIVNALITVRDDIGLILDRYMAGDGDICSTTDCDTNIEATVMLSRYVETISKSIELAYSDADYTGIIDSNGVWGELRVFLKDFGRLCFDLETKSNFSSLTMREKDDEKIIGATTNYVNELLDMLNSMLRDVDFGSEGSSITKITSLDEIIACTYNEEDEEFEYYPITGDSKYSELTSESKYYVSLLCDYFEKTTAEINSIIKEAEDAYNMIAKFKNGRYTIQPNSLIYTTYIKNYLEHFKYNVDSSNVDFVEYIYEDYYLEVNEGFVDNSDLSDSDKLNYYFRYVESFDNFKFANSGNYFSDLTALQQKVIKDCVSYYEKIKIDTEAVLGAEYQEQVNNLNILNSFVFATEEAPVTADAGTISIIESNYDVLNLYNILYFMGLDFDVKKGLRDYRIDALNQLVDFSEYSGESAASIQTRFLSLLYLACSDFTTNAEGNTYIGYDDNSKQIILTLAGIQDKADENLVNLEYEGNYSSSVADEKYGSIFIICTYNEDTKMYEPFIFASAPDKHNTPYTSYYKSVNNMVTYYPVIAKGIFDNRGNPTAIREVNGFIEFYRDEVYTFKMAAMSTEVYTVTEENVSSNHGFIGSIVSTIKQTFNRFLSADSLGDMFAYVDVDLDSERYYGTKTKIEYHLDGGYCNLNYMFFEASGIEVQHLYDITQLNLIILVIASTIILKAMWNVLYGVVGSMYQIAILFAISPTVIGIYPLKSDAYKNWKKNFTKQFFVMYGYIVALNAYFIIMMLIEDMGSLFTSFNERSIEILENTYIFSQIDVFSIVSFLLTTTLLLVATTMLDSLSGTFSGELFNGENASKSGKKYKDQVNATVHETEDFVSGYAFKDAVAKEYNTFTKNYAPFLEPDAVRSGYSKIQQSRNHKKAEDYKNKLLAQGIDANKAKDAAAAYEAALNQKIQTTLNHAKEEANRRKAREEARTKRAKSIAETKADNKKVKCKHCGYEFDKKHVKGATKCPHCGQNNAFK